MNVAEIYAEAYRRITEVVRQAVEAMSLDNVLWRPEPGSNPIAWLVWHLSRIQDDHVAEIAGHPQQWETGRWAGRFGLAEGTAETGHGHTAEQVAALRPDDVATLLDYHQRVADASQSYLGGVDEAELGRIIDTRYDPPVTVGVRLVSVLSDNLQHAGQARYLRGMIERLEA